MRIAMKTCAGLIAAALSFGAAWAQQYPGGSHSIASPQGTLVVNSGFVNNFNVHTFHVYSFLFKPKEPGADWQQVPIVEGADISSLKFLVTTASTADFTLRDAKVSVVGGRLVLHVAEKRYKDTPYDEHAPIEVRRYELRKTQDEGRWVFDLVSMNSAGVGTAVEDALRARSKTPRGK